MFKILIVEDDMQQLEFLTQTIKDSYPTWDVVAVSDFHTAITLIDNSITDKAMFSLFLFDIQLSSDTSDRDGFNIAKHLRMYSDYYMTPILFLTSITSQTQFALSNYHCYNYITKPYTGSDIITQLQQLLYTGYLKKTHIRIKDINNVIHNIPFSDIYYLNSNLHCIQLHMSSHKVTFRGYTLDTILDALPNNFIRCHRRFIINTEKIANIDITNQCVSLGKDSIPIGRTYIEIIQRLKGVL